MRSEAELESILERKLRRLFPDETARRAAAQELARYGRKDHEREAVRVRLAILKVSGASLNSVRSHVEVAVQDHRDLLSSAEFPNQAKEGTWRLSDEERARLAKADEEQYDAWLAR
jgi:hypothetical protein